MPLLSRIIYITSKVIREATLKHKSGWNTPERDREHVCKKCVRVFFLVWFVSLKGEKVSMTCAATYQQGAINVFWPLPRSPTAVNFLPAVCRQTTQQRPVRFQWEILQSPTAFMILPVTKRSRLRFLPATVRERMRRNPWTLAVLPVPEVCSIEIRFTKVKGIHTYSPPKLKNQFDSSPPQNKQAARRLWVRSEKRRGDNQQTAALVADGPVNVWI